MAKRRQEKLSALEGIKKRGAKNFNLWYFRSPKIGRRLEICSDIAFMHIVLIEGNPRIRSYTPESPTVMAHDGEELRSTRYDARIQFTDSHHERWEFKHSSEAGPEREGRSKGQLSAQAAGAQEAGEKYRVLTERDLQDQTLAFDNWLLLCGAMNRCARFNLSREARLISEQLGMHRGLSLDYFLRLPETDSALVLAALARGLQRGVLHTELSRKLLTLDSVIEFEPTAARRAA